MLPTSMWQQLRKFPVRLNNNIQTNYFRTKNGDEPLKYNIKSDQSLCVGKYSMSSTAYLSRHITFNKEALIYDCYTVLYPNYAKGIVCHTSNRYHTQYTAVPKVLVHLCVCLWVCVCCHPIFSRRLSSPFGISWARQSGSHKSFDFLLSVVGQKNGRSTAVQQQY